jgi:hypothetical protein
MAIYNKQTGDLISKQGLDQFFSPLGLVLNLSDPQIQYDSLLGRWVVGILDFDGLTFSVSHFDFAVSSTSDPTGGWQFRRFDMNDTGGIFFSDFADFPRLGYNADAWVISFNMFVNGVQDYDHVQLLSIDKSSLTGFHYVVPGGKQHATLVPAVMHTAQPGDPMWLVEEANPDSPGAALQIVKMTNILSDRPQLTPFQVTVPSYTAVVPPTQPGGIVTDNIDSRILSAALRGNELVAAQNVGNAGHDHARWYAFDLSGSAPVLTQESEIVRGPDVDTYYPAIDIAPNGDVGMSYVESSAHEFISMYVTGRTQFDSPGTLETPVLVAAGQVDDTSTRAGDYSGISIDPITGNFWAANEYTIQEFSGFDFGGWATFISQFRFLHPGILQFSAPRYDVSEYAREAVITVTRTGGSDGTIAVNYVTSDGTATAGIRYLPEAGTLTFADGETNKTITIPILQDNGTVEGRETVNVILSSPAGGAVLGTQSSAVLTIHDVDGTPNQRFIADVYWDLLGRQVDPTGLDGWSRQLDNGLPRDQMALLIESSLEYQISLIKNLYRQFLRRDPDPAGLNGWLNFLAQGGTSQELEALLIGSPEYFARAGGTNTGFLQNLYLDVLARPIDSGGLSGWSRVLAAGVPRSVVALSVLQNAESDAVEVNTTYERFLDRPADPNGLNAFVTELESGMTAEQLNARIIGSAEYFSRI